MDSYVSYRLLPTDHLLISQIADWYLAEWEIPRERTINRLSSQPGDDVLFQYVAYVNGKAAATGGLCNYVGLLEQCPQFRVYRPWVSLLYVADDYRRRGLGTQLLEAIEQAALNLGFAKLYLHTFTAERLYLRRGWRAIDAAFYKGHLTSVMEKTIPGSQSF